MESVKTIGEFEKEQGKLLRGDVDPTQEISMSEFTTLSQTNGFTGVDHAKRIEFLEANGYEVTRENMVDSTLSATPPTETETSEEE